MTIPTQRNVSGFCPACDAWTSADERSPTGHCPTCHQMTTFERTLLEHLVRIARALEGAKSE